MEGPAEDGEAAGNRGAQRVFNWGRQEQTNRGVPAASAEVGAGEGSWWSYREENGGRPAATNQPTGMTGLQLPEHAIIRTVRRVMMGHAGTADGLPMPQRQGCLLAGGFVPSGASKSAPKWGLGGLGR